jgi:hypothetical protein
MISDRKILLVFIIFIFNSCLYSQVKPEPKERTVAIEEPVVFKDSLPKISLPDFVITGKEKIDITNRSKLEFFENRIFITPKNSNPNFESKDLSAALIETSLKGGLSNENPIDIFSGFVKGEYGNFNSPAASAGVIYAWDIYKAALSGNFLSRAENVKNSDFSNGCINLSLGANIPKTDNLFNEAKVKLDLNYNTKSYNYYGSLSWPPWLDSPNYLPDPFHKKNSSITLDASINSEGKKYFKYDVDLLFNRFKDDNNNLYFIPIHTENKIKFSISGEYEYDKYIFSGSLLLNNNNITNQFGPTAYIQDNGTTETVLYPDLDKNSLLFGLSLNAASEIMPSLFAKAGLKFYSYDYILSYNTKNDMAKGIFLPQLSIRYENNKNLSVSLCYAPDLEIMSLEKLYQINPFIYPADIKHCIDDVNLFINAYYAYSDNLRMNATFGYREQKNTPNFYNFYNTFFQSFAAEIIDEKAKGIYCDLNIDYQLNYNNDFSFTFNYQNKRVESKRIPYTPDFCCSLDYITLLNMGLTLNPSLSFISDRRSDIFYEYMNGGYKIYQGDIETLKSIFLLNLDAEYPIYKNLIASLNINNILNTKYSYYNGYEEYPFSIFAGIKFKW